MSALLKTTHVLWLSERESAPPFAGAETHLLTLLPALVRAASDGVVVTTAMLGFVRSDDEQSLLTFMVYLNEGFAGGETRFFESGVTVTPRTGLALLFQHFLLHEGASVTAGVKYALRTDVMYRR